MTSTGTHFTTVTADEDEVPSSSARFVVADDVLEPADLPLLRAAEDALATATRLVAAVGEVRERLWAGRLDFESRTDLWLDTYEQAAQLQSFVLALELAVQR